MFDPLQVIGLPMTADTNIVTLDASAFQKLASKFEEGLSGSAITPMDRLQISQFLTRVWSRHLNNAEFRILDHIIDRTVRWGRPTFTSTHETILNGNEHFAGVNMSMRTYERALSNLVKRGMVFRKRHQTGVTLSLNLRWMPENEEMSLPIPKRKQSGPAIVAEQNRHSGGTLYRNGSSRKENVLVASDDGVGKSEEKSLAEIIAEKTAEFEKNKSARIEKAKKKKIPNATDFYAIWKMAVADHHEGLAVPDPTIKQAGIVNKAIKRYGTGSPTLLELAEWAVANWSAILSRRFAKMENLPEKPTINWFLSEGILAAMADFYASGELSKVRRRRRGPNKQAEIERLMATGLSHEEAVLQVAEDTAKRDLRREMQNSQRVADQKLAEARAAEDRAKAPRWTGPHPDSPAERDRRRVEAQQRIAEATPDEKITNLPTWEEIQQRRAAGEFK